MSDDDAGGDGVTRADLAELADGLQELRDAFAGMRAATTPAARREAGEDVQDAKDDLDATARRLGVSREKLEESIAAARKAERKEELREPLRELLDELRAADEAKNDDGDGEPPAKRKPAKRKPPAADAGGDDPDPPHVDDPPMREHWSERGVGAMLR